MESSFLIETEMELKLRQKKEEFQKKEAQYKQEINELKEKLDNKKEDDEVKKLKDIIEEMEKRENELFDQLNEFTGENSLERKINEIQEAITETLSEAENLRNAHEIIKRELETMETSFANLYQKYEGNKAAIADYKSNIDSLEQDIIFFDGTIQKNEMKYTMEINILHKIIKSLQRKNTSLVKALKQITKECIDLVALSDEEGRNSEEINAVQEAIDTLQTDTASFTNTLEQIMSIINDDSTSDED